MMRSATHFVGFRSDEYHRGRRIFGEPDFIHQRWDTRARREIADVDRVIFATGDEHSELTRFNAADLIEETAAVPFERSIAQSDASR